MENSIAKKLYNNWDDIVSRVVIQKELYERLSECCKEFKENKMPIKDIIKTLNLVIKDLK